MTEEKKLILVLSDHPLSPSGVGTQTRYFIEAMLATGKYRFICFGGAMKHQNYQPVKVDPHGDFKVTIFVKLRFFALAIFGKININNMKIIFIFVKKLLQSLQSLVDLNINLYVELHFCERV